MTTASNPLARLIDAVKEANRWSDPMIVDRARRAGHQISKSLISTIRREGMTTLVPGTIRALADGLGVPVVRVLRAALETAGLPVDDEMGTPEVAIQNDPVLSESVKRMLLTIIKEARQPTRPSRSEVEAAIANELRTVGKPPGRVNRNQRAGDQPSQRDDMTP